MYIKIIYPSHNIMFECDKIVETEGCLQFMLGSEFVSQYNPAVQDFATIYVMNNDGKTVDRYNFTEKISQVVENKED